MWNYSSLNCGSPRKRFVEVEISFDYPNKQEIKRIFSHVAAPGGYRIVENQIFNLTGSQCSWGDSRRESQSLAIKIRKAGIM
jgi:hypothetical protein